MKYVVVDLEMNTINRNFVKERKICCMETIEIGAVALDENYMEIDSFKTLVKPEYNDIIERKIENLTKISTDSVKSAPNFNDALNLFFSWCDNLDDKIEFIQWSESDYIQITSEMKLKKYTVNRNTKYLLNSWRDFQKEFNEEIGLSNRVSLKNALNYVGIDFYGNEHDALFDAKNTANLLGIVRIPEKRTEKLNTIIDALRPKNDNLLLSDLIDFSKFNFDFQ